MALRLRVYPQLGARRLAEIEREDLQRFVNELIAHGASPALIEATINPVRAFYRHAMKTPSLGIVVNPRRARKRLYRAAVGIRAAYA